MRRQSRRIGDQAAASERAVFAAINFLKACGATRTGFCAIRTPIKPEGGQRIREGLPKIGFSYALSSASEAAHIGYIDASLGKQGNLLIHGPHIGLFHEISNLVGTDTIARHDLQNDRITQKILKRRFVPIRHICLLSSSGTSKIGTKHDGAMARS
jgi:hypothetical protein